MLKEQRHDVYSQTHFVLSYKHDGELRFVSNTTKVVILSLEMFWQYGALFMLGQRMNQYQKLKR